MNVVQARVGLLFVPVLLASVTATPIVVQQDAKLSCSDTGEQDFFGISSAMEGNTLVIGSRGGPWFSDAGAAYVFVNDGTSWVEEAKLQAGDVELDNRFGDSVAVSGDTIVVGAPRVGADDAGAVYVFARSSSTWSEEAKLVDDAGTWNDFFGTSVAIHGDTIVVGAPWDDDLTGYQSGSAHVFVREEGSWSRQARLKAPGAESGDMFGHSVSLWGETTLIGALGDGDAGPGAGSAHVFVRDGSTWSHETELHAGDHAEYDLFGHSVCLWGDTAVVGAIEDDHAAADAGSAYVFVRDGTSWSQEGKLTAPNPTPWDEFGAAVSVWGDVVVVGSPRHDVPVGDTGSAYVYVRNGTVWNFRAKLVASDAAADDHLGYSVAVSGSTVVAGAYLDDAPAFQSGSAYVFDTPLAANALRNAGSNPQSYTARALRVGDTFRAQVDRSLAGKATSLLLAFDTPVDVVLSGGQHLLCLDTSGAGELFTGSGLLPTTTAGQTDTFALPVPPLPSLLGEQFCSQAVELSPAPFVLSNAFDHTIGF